MGRYPRHIDNLIHDYIMAAISCGIHSDIGREASCLIHSRKQVRAFYVFSGVHAENNPIESKE